MGGGSSSPAPVQQNVNNTQIPDYLAPYASNMLNATQAQIFNPDMTTFKAYQPYSTNPSDYFAAFSPMQQQAQSTVANLQTPDQFNQASNLAGTAGQGALNTVGQAGMYGGMANRAGQQGANLSNMYGGLGSQAGQQAANLSNMYGGQGAQTGQQYAGLSADAGQQGANLGNQFAGQSSMYGGMGAMQGQQGANIGQQLGQMSTDPNAVQSYMNPYIQSSLNPQLQLLGQQTGIQSAGEQAAATRSGAFGGSREALQNSLVQQGGNLAAQQAIGQGYNTAFNNAQQQMNAANAAALTGNQQALSGYGMGLQGANQAGNMALQGNQQALSGYGQAASQALQGLGMGLQGAGQAGSQAMQGYGMGLQGANQAANLGIQGAQAGLAGVGAQQAGYGQAGTAGTNLANIGNMQLGATENIANLQNQVGGQQTQAQQNIINQAVQNYATAQQYPFMQLGVMNAMLRGLPTQQTSTTMYQAPPSTVSQLGGLGLAGLGGLGMYNAATGSKRGGKVKAMATGGAVPMTMMNDQQLQQVQQSQASSPMAKMYAQGLDQMHGYIHNNPEASKVMSQPLPSGGMPPPDQMSTAPQTRTGVAAIGTGDMTKMAGGGILAFGSGKEVPPADDQWMSDLLKSQLTDAFSGKNTVAEAYKPLAEEQKADLAQQRAMVLPEFAFRTGIGMMSGAGDRTGSPFQNFVSGLGTSALGAESGMQKSLADINAAKKLMQQGTISAATADQARRDTLLGQLNQAYTGSQNVKAQLANARAIKEAGYASAGAARDVGMYNAAAKAYEDAVLKARTILQNGEMKTTFEVHPEQLDAAAGALAYQYTPQKSREILGLKPPVIPTATPNPAPAPTTNNPFSNYFLGQNPNPNVVPFSSLPQNPILMPK
jgi:hypothetical protein